ncbi:MAG TPA: aldehyde dehydrogenase family protein [Steroidobacteraceae bacterium]|nr:aldehyde dehydrogenase family protein [Steroidobacteraceae bacterium]
MGATAGGTVGKTLLEDRRVDAITFTGSVPTGAAVLRAATGRGAKVQLEMGGKNPLVLLRCGLLPFRSAN